MDQSVIEPRGYVRGGFGEEMDAACLSITAHFAALPGWDETRISPHEVVYLAGFLAFIALASPPTAPLGLAEAATGAKATVARRLMLRGTRAELMNERLKWFKARLNKYSTLWVGVLTGTNSFGAFAELAFENVQAGAQTRRGYVEHLNARWSTFHEYFRVLKKRGIAVNFATLAGHDSIRPSVIGYEDKPLDDIELKKMQTLFKEGNF